MTTFWDAPNGGALTGTERFGADKAGSGDPADSPHYTADQIKAFALLGLTPAQIGAATAAEVAAALAAAQGAQTTANAALPKPGGTTTAGGIVLGTGTTGAAVEVSTTTLQFVLDSLTAIYNLAAGAEAIGLDARSPFVQADHDAATRTLLAADAGDIIPLDGTSNAIAITVPGSLFGTGGTDRAFVCQHKVLSVAGGALTFVGSAGIATMEYYGKNPGTTPYAAGDYLTVVVDSATTGYVFCASVIP